MKSRGHANLSDLLTKHTKPKDKVDAEMEEDDGEPEEEGKVIVVSNRLPVKKGDNGGLAIDEGAFLAAIRRARPQERRVVYVGQFPSSVAVEEEEQEDAERRLKELGCRPVFIPPEEEAQFYEGMCKGTLWPLLHYVMPLEKADRFRRVDWQSYIAANRKFVDAVVQELSAESDIVLVNDYHLFPLPTLLRKHFHSVRCGFFLHSPFPSSELLRAFPMREVILRGMLNADLVGLHTYDYARHFLSCCSRILGLQYETTRGKIDIDVLGRRVRVMILPAGVSEQLHESFHSVEASQAAALLSSQHSSRHVFLSIDDLDGLKGLDLKLEAFELFLQSTPLPVRLIQVINPCNHSSKFSDLRRSVHAFAERINSRYASAQDPAVEIVEKKLDSAERVALYSIADTYLLTAVRDGLNMHPYEYVLCRHLASRVSTTVVSEFVGCSPSLAGAIRVNPWNTEATAEAMRRALTMDAKEREVRHARNYKYVSTHTSERWARQLIGSIESATEGLSRKRNYGLGFGLNFKVVSVDDKFERLDHGKVLESFAGAQGERVVFLDYDGTLTAQQGCSIDIAPSNEVMATLRALRERERVTVCIVSGRDKGNLEEWFRNERLALAAEHGQFIKPADSGWWERQVELSNSWQQVALPLLESYKESTDGSTVQVKESSAAWHYACADPDFGSWQAKELMEHLVELLGHPMEVKKSSIAVEVKPRGVSKGLAVTRLLESVQSSRGPVSCVVALGDDRSDEDMFTALSQFADAQTPGKNLASFSCTVGQKPSRASFYVDDSSEVLSLLQTLAASPDPSC